ncbi:MAG: hypothetical protein LBE06_04915, partial [Azoarcus sp.]|nr:hypothetical protein [Azoarcus sp.]
DIPFIRPKPHTFDGEHYWEINKRGYSLKTVMNAIKKSGEDAGFTLEKHYRVFENPYHHFFVLKKTFIK